MDNGSFTKGSSCSWILGKRPKSARKRPPLTVRFQGSEVVIAAALSTSTPSFVPLIKLYIRANGSTVAAIPSSALRKSNSPPAVPRFWILASSTRPMEGFSAVGALCTAWTDFSTSPILVELADFSLSSWSIRSKAFFNCSCMSPICFLSVSVTDSCAKPILGKIKYHTSKLADAARVLFLKKSINPPLPKDEDILLPSDQEGKKRLD